MTTAAVSEPAIKSYFFGKGYVDLRNTIVDSWQRNSTSAQAEFAQFGPLWATGWGGKALAILRGSAGVSILLFGTALFLSLSLVHIVILVTFFLLIYLGFTLVYLTERGYLAWRRFSAVCPLCHHQERLPEYLCEQCGAVHRKLIPSQYGILSHTCLCGHKLPATFFLGRAKLPCRCASCGGTLVQGNFESDKAFVPVFGGPLVGKSAYLFGAVERLVEAAAPRGIETAFLDTVTQGEFVRARSLMQEGQTVEKTIARLPRAFNLQLQEGTRAPTVLYLYDPAGEAFGDTAGLVEHSYQKFLSGLLFLVDPFALPAVRRHYQVELEGAGAVLQPSTMLVEDAFARILIGMEEHFGLHKGGRIKKPVAVVVTKIDAFDLETRLGEPAWRHRAATASPPLALADARDQVIREQLRAWDQGDLVQQMETRCAQLRYFACSSLGYTPDGSGRGFEPRGVLEPLLWVLGSVSGPVAALARRLER
jgi:hypothetical protein